MNATKLVHDHAPDMHATKLGVLFAMAYCWDSGDHKPVEVAHIAKVVHRSVSNTRKIMWQLNGMSLVVPDTDNPLKNGPWKLNIKTLRAIKTARSLVGKGAV